MADPTKGPWRLSGAVDGYRHVNGHAWAHLARVVVADDAGTPIPTGEANARLIALAPEMAELLRELEWVTFYDDENGGTTERCLACFHPRAEGHTPACRLGNLLKRMEG